MACEGGVEPLGEGDISAFQKQLTQPWEVANDHHIQRTFNFGDFKEAMQFVNKVAEIAEEQGHHPNISIFYDTVELVLYTHAIDGLHQNDFIVAEKINQLFNDH